MTESMHDRKKHLALLLAPPTAHVPSVLGSYFPAMEEWSFEQLNEEARELEKVMNAAAERNPWYYTSPLTPRGWHDMTHEQQMDRFTRVPPETIRQRAARLEMMLTHKGARYAQRRNDTAPRLLRSDDIPPTMFEPDSGCELRTLLSEQRPGATFFSAPPAQGTPITVIRTSEIGQNMEQLERMAAAWRAAGIEVRRVRLVKIEDVD